MTHTELDLRRKTMKKRVAKILSIALVGAMALSMAACGNKGEDPCRSIYAG